MANSYAKFRSELLEAQLLWATECEGLYLRSETFEAIVRGIDNIVSNAGSDLEATVMYPPLVVPRTLIEQTDYIRSFPDLSGSIMGFTGGQKESRELFRALDDGEDWTKSLDVTELALCSAGCHPIYPTVVGPLPATGRYFEVHGNCFRHEPSIDPARMQVFRQHEFVYIGDEAGAEKHQARWVEAGLEIHESLGLEIKAVVANDPFFGRTGEILATNQRSSELKWELVSPICSEEEPTAITSSNRHLDHFGAAFGIELEDGEVAHSACVGFGLERITLALLHTHGLDTERWPTDVRQRLGL